MHNKQTVHNTIINDFGPRMYRLVIYRTKYFCNTSA